MTGTQIGSVLASLVLCAPGCSVEEPVDDTTLHIHSTVATEIDPSARLAAAQAQINYPRK